MIHMAAPELQTSDGSTSRFSLLSTQRSPIPFLKRMRRTFRAIILKVPLLRVPRCPRIRPLLQNQIHHRGTSNLVERAGDQSIRPLIRRRCRARALNRKSVKASPMPMSAQVFGSGTAITASVPSIWLNV